MRTTAVLITCLGLGACASQSSHRGLATPIRSGGAIERAVDPATGLTSIVVSPSPVDLGGSARQDGLSLSVGAHYAARSASDRDPQEVFALLFVAATDGASPVFEGDRRLLLDIDGQLFTSTRSAAGRVGLYGSKATETGVRERVLVPVSSDIIQRLAEAKRVRGRLGSWVTFELTPEQLVPFRSLNQASAAVAPVRVVTPTKRSRSG